MNKSLNLLDADTVAEKNKVVECIAAATSAVEAACSEFLNLRAGAVSEWALSIMDALDALIDAAAEANDYTDKADAIRAAIEGGAE